MTIRLIMLSSMTIGGRVTQKHHSAYTDFMLIFLTAWLIVSPESELVYRVFSDLPERPEELK